MDRRESLTLLAGAAAALAGCNGLSGSSSSSSSEPGEPVTDGPSSGTATDPEMRLFRVDTDRKPVYLPESDGDGPPSPRPDDRFLEHVVVDAESRAERLATTESVDAAAVESFLDGTDFDTETVYVEPVRVDECFRLELCRISWQPTEVSTDYTRRTRPYDEACRVDEQVFEVRLVRIPDALDADDVNGFSSSIGTAGCGSGRPRPVGESGSTAASMRAPARNGTATPNGGDGE